MNPWIQLTLRERGVFSVYLPLIFGPEQQEATTVRADPGPSLQEFSPRGQQIESGDTDPCVHASVFA